MSVPILRAIRGGAALTLAAAPLLYLLVRIFEHDSIRALVVPALVSTFVLGTLLWRSMVLTKAAAVDDMLGVRGFLAGFFTGILVHPFAWAGPFLVSPTTVDAGQAVAGIIYYSMLSLIITGVVTAGVGGGVGVLLTRFAFFRPASDP